MCKTYNLKVSASNSVFGHYTTSGEHCPPYRTTIASGSSAAVNATVYSSDNLNYQIVLYICIKYMCGNMSIL